jgi:hypothetical protein
MLEAKDLTAYTAEKIKEKIAMESEDIIAQAYDMPHKAMYYTKSWYIERPEAGQYARLMMDDCPIECHFSKYFSLVYSANRCFYKEFID